ncbi:MAG: OmpH family outer membrane protein [Spirochaetia bacterium]
MKRKTLIAGALLLLFSGVLSAEQLTTVAVIDISKVYNSFYRDSRSVRELEQLKEEYQEEIDEEVAELNELREELEEAEESGTQSRVDELESEVDRQRRYVEDLTSRRREQLESREQNLVSDDFLNRLQDAITHVAENEGYTVVLRSDQDGLQWWSSTVDISDDVLDRLRDTDS